MKSLTIRQPWASLIAAGVKTIETRSRRTHYRGPLAIHAAKSRITWNELDAPSLVSERATIDAVLRAFGVMDENGTHPMPWYDYDRNVIEIGMGLGDHPDAVTLHLGAVVAVADLVDCVPIIGADDGVDEPWMRHVAPNQRDGRLWLWRGEDDYAPTPRWKVEDIEDQRPFGDFAPGRWAWLLNNVRPLAEPVPMKGHQGLRDVPEDIATQIKAQLS